ncbi:phosphatidylglycerol lysyltransferase [Thermanaeromonas toyohensis ToBE]|uniref:Phosphatidylglycerol lysyltransferase n=1 Tax=Thermanaeromonas toyohensis ToBE TaxID=698762 RepID=A0A1W1VWA0_9FIRM|nr:phosphatidylglycerol lysyltransferase domain-containing protein [Thermanaeromonas toyohensis]SMB97652.1 phosphatidylglycerol lysyltransferase [Thermanaeromonas toyohensis ToBE]
MSDSFPKVSRPHLAAFLVGLLGLGNILSAWLVHHPARLFWLKQHLPWTVLRVSWLGNVFAGSAELFLSWSLVRRKTQAWRIAVFMLLISAITSLLRGLNYVQAGVNSAILAILLALKSEFTAASDPPSVRYGLAVLAGTVLFTYLYGLFGFYLLDRHFHQRFDLTEASRQTVAFLTWSSTPALERPNRLARWFLDSLAAIQALGIIYGLTMVLRPVIYRHTVLPAERERAAEIVQKYGRSSLAHLTLLPDKVYYFSRSGNSFVAYALVGNVALVLGDPIGPEEEIPQIIAEFTAYCGRNDWYPAFYQVLPDYLPAYEACGYKVLKIGEEAVVDLHHFTLSGNRQKSLRQAVNRMVRKGYTTELILPPLSDEILRQLKEVSDQWLRRQKGGEKRFSLGWFDPSYLRGCQVMVVRDAEGHILAFANIIPEYQKREGTIDLMRRKDGENGLMDLMFVRLIEHFKKQGYDTFNLGLCPLAGVGEAPGASLQERTAHFFYQHFNKLYAFKGLRRFKEKFAPRWEPRYLVYPHHLLLPKIALAVVTANAGGSLLSYAKAWWEKRKST